MLLLPRVYDSKQSDYNFQKPYSDATAQIIDEEVKKIIQSAYDRTKELLKDKLKELEILAQELLEKEIIYQSDLEKLIGKRPFDTQTTYEEYTTPTAEVKEEVKKVTKSVKKSDPEKSNKEKKSKSEEQAENKKESEDQEKNDKSGE